MVLTNINKTKIRAKNLKEAELIRNAAAFLGYESPYFILCNPSFKGEIFLYFESFRVHVDSDYQHFKKYFDKEIFFYDDHFHATPKDKQENKEPISIDDVEIDEDEKKNVEIAKGKAVIKKAFIKLAELGYSFNSGEWLSKEEEEKKAKLEAAYDLYLCAWHEDVKGWGGTLSFDKFCYAIEKGHIIDYVAIVDKTGYSKGDS